jgi:LPXTG-motif cell wall-anchored protein
VNDAALGRVIGTAWFDINQNNKKDANEPLLAGVDVEVRPRAVSSQSLRGVRASALTVKTTSTGAFDFSNLAPGVYQIIGALPGDYGIEQSWDSSGNADWTVTVTVLANKTSRGDFAAIGTVATSGCVTGSTANSTLNANWAGFDGVLGTSDDASFGTGLGADCEFDLSGLPTGSYKVEAKNSTGKVFASSALRVSKNSSEFKSGAISMTIRIVRTLPETGAQSMKDWLSVAMVLTAGGGGVSMTNRRRRRA